MSTRFVRLLLVVWMVWGVAGVVRAQEPTGSLFPNRFTGRQIIVATGADEKRPEYRLLDNGLLFYREGADGPFEQLGQHPKEKTQEWFRRLEQELKVKTQTGSAPDNAVASVGWKKGKTEFTAAWADKKDAPEGYRTFYEDFLKLFPKKKK